MKTKYLLIGALSVFAASAIGAVSQDSFGMTNAIAKNATVTTNLGGGVKVDNYADLSFVWRVYSTHTDAGNITITFARSGDGTTWETGPQFTQTFPITSKTNNPQYVWVNVPATTVGSSAWIKPVSVANTNANIDLTNSVLSVVRKRPAPVR